jgi:DNA modification methylase
MKIELKKLSDLKPAPYNPRQSNAEQEKQLKSSLEKFGVVEPIIFNKQTGFIVGGHFRIRELKKLGYKEIECVIVDLNEADEKELNIRLNANTGSWDWDELANNWDSELLSDWGLEIPGFEPTILEAEEDDFTAPEGGIETDIVLGDLFEIGEHRLLCGDSTDSDSVAKLMNESKFDILVTSPPYNQGNGSGDLLTNGKKEVRLYDDKNADNKSKLEYYDFLISILNIAFIFKNDIHSICWNVSYNAKSRDDYGKIIFSKDNPFTVHETIIWDKGHSINLPQVGIYSRRCEFVFIMSDYDKYLTSQTYNDCRWNVWNISSNKSQTTGEQTEHRAAYPIEFASKMINDFSLIGNLIYEPFTGSGTTMVAAHQLNRKCYGMELDPKYCQVIVDRMKKLDPTIKIKRNGIELK